jgi:hypothetical protein
MRRLELDELAQEAVVLGVGDRRLVERVVAVVVLVDLAHQLEDPLLGLAPAHDAIRLPRAPAAAESALR